MTAQLAVRDLSGGYGRLAIFRGLDLNLSERRTFGVLGPNGSGKTTLLKTVAGLLPAFAGEVLLEGVALGRKSAYQRTRAGLVLVPEGRQVLVKLSVLENLELTQSAGRLSPSDFRIGLVGDVGR